MNTDEKIKKLLVNKLPTCPGVYQFFNSSGEILYIGKAKNLRSRVKSYFVRAEELKNNRSEAIYQMVSQVYRIKVFELESEIESLLLESELVNKVKPKYNSRLKDDKSHYLVSVSKNKPQKITLVRSKNTDLQDKNYYFFGPYLSGDSLKKALRFLRKIFPYPDCSQAKYFRQMKAGRGCLYSDIKLCLAPCENKESFQSDQQIKFLISFLSGKKQQLIRNLEKKMNLLSNKKKYEEATKIRDQIFSLRNLGRYSIGIRDSFLDFQEQTIFPRIEAYDISNIGGDFAVGAMTVASLGKIDKKEYKKFKIKSINEQNDIAMTAEIIERRLKNDWPRANLIIIDGGVSHLRFVSKILNNLELKIPVVAIAKGIDRKKDELHFSDPEVAGYFKGNKFLMMLIIELRNEAHRFSQNYYRYLHRRSLIK